MAVKSEHEFSVWHPQQGGLPKYEVMVFGFTYPVSRTYARKHIERVEGYVIEKNRRKKNEQ